MTAPPTFRADEADIPALVAATGKLTALGYDEARVRQRLGLDDLTDLRWRTLPIYRKERLAAREPLDSAIDLFLLQGIIPAPEMDRLFSAEEQAALKRVGLLAGGERGMFYARASLYPVCDRLVFSDHAWPKLPHPGIAEVPFDQVMYIGADTRWLARATVRRTVETALDLCTGSGVHALLAAAHAKRVLAVDINPRAASCAHFNALAFGASNMEVAVGDLYQPAGQARFDLITANPPFVPSPVHAVGYRDGGPSGEDVQRRIVAGLAKHLAPGGMAQIVTEIGEREDEPVDERVRSWLDGAPMDILVLRLAEHPTATYALGHAEGDRDFGEFLASVESWHENLKRQGYVRIVTVLLAFQWSDPAFGAPWTRVETTDPPRREAGSEVEDKFLAERTARRADLQETLLAGGRVLRSGPIGLMESRMLGTELRTDARAQLLGRSFSSIHWLGPVEREVLLLMEHASEVAELVSKATDLGLEREAVLAAVCSLLQRGLIRFGI